MGEDACLIPVGGSNEIGLFGYITVFQEMISQVSRMGKIVESTALNRKPNLTQFFTFELLLLVLVQSCTMHSKLK